MAETVVPRKFEIEKPIEDTPQGKDKRAQSWDFGLGHELMRNDPGAIVAGNAPTGEAPFDRVAGPRAARSVE